ncbi:TonB-dependent siderophore receptor [Rhizobium sp. LEGMi135b]
MRFRGNIGENFVGALLMGTALAMIGIGGPVMAQQATGKPAAVETKSFNIRPQSLQNALVIFGQQAGIQVSVDAAVLRGLSSPGVTGGLTPQTAVARLLAGTGLGYRFTSPATVLINRPGLQAGGLAADGSTVLQPIMIEGAGGTAALQGDGLAKDGYRASTLSSLGLLGQTAIRDTPFSVSVAPRELIQNIQAQSPEDIYRVLPTVRSQTPQISGWAPMANMRGFTTYDTAEDGFRRSYSHGTVLEDKERIEVLSGLSGFLYGAASPAGMINYVYKRPTAERLNSITTGTYGAGQAYVHGDFGGPIDPEGDMAYRLNIVRAAGDTAIDDQSIDRFLASGAFDWNITDRLKLEVNASYTKSDTDVPNSYWSFQSGVLHGDAPDASKNWSQPWIRDEINKKRISAKLTYELNDAITLRGGYMREYIDRPVQDHTMNSVRAPGEYYQIAIHSGETKDIFEAANLFADASFDTGSVSHKLTVGYHMYQDRSWQTTYNPNTGWIGPFPMSSPLHLDEPIFPADTSSPYYAGYVRNHNFVLGDHIEFDEQWSALVGANYSIIQSRSLDSTGALTDADYDQGRLSPSVSLMFKPVEQITLYGSYIEGLEQGGVAPVTATNYGQIMAPMVSKQKEIGIKADVGNVLLTAALFDISKAYELTTDAGLYTQDGRQRHRGVELTATGRVMDNLTILGGFTWLDARVEGGAYDGNRPMNVANVLAKLYAEYEMPSVEGLFFTGGLYYTGRQWANAENNDRLSPYVTADLGMRYTVERDGNPLTLRLNVSNITNESYWQNSYYLGAPRTVSLSLQAKF